MGEPIKIGLAGLGRAGWGMHVKELQRFGAQFTLAAVCDPIEERRTTAKDTYGCAAYETIEELVRDPQVELIDITTRSADHFAHGMLALSAGKHVLMEKPFAQTYAQALELAKMAEAAGLRIYVRHNRRFDPDFLHVREWIDGSLLGEVYMIKLHRHSYSRRSDWQTLKAYGGGQLLNWGPHIVDHALCFLDSPVKDLWSDLQNVAAAGDAEDHVKIVLKGENGRVVDLEISGGMAFPQPTYLVYGTKGSLSLTGKEITVKYLDPERPLTAIEADPGTPGAAFGTTGTYQSGETLPWIERRLPVAPERSYDIWNELYESMRNGATYPILMSQALEVVRVIEQVKQETSFA